jgi:hypothetical protein
MNPVVLLSQEFDQNKKRLRRGRQGKTERE